MLGYSVYSEAGGVAKTTTAANCAVAHARHGHRVLVVDLDPQNASLSYLFDVDDERADGEADNLVRHLIGRPKGELLDLVRETEEGIDVLPTHNMHERLTELLLKTAEIEEQTHGDPDYEFPKHAQLLEVLRKSGVNERYDVLVVDPPANGEQAQNNALYATRNVVIPVELSGKGQQSIAGLEEVVDGLERHLGMNMGVLSLVPFKYEGTNDQNHYLDELEETGFDIPIVIGKRTSLMEGCWREQCSAFEYVEEHRSRQRDHEMRTLEQYDRLARHIEATGGLASEAPEAAESDGLETNA
ncbi:ParA family protein [Halegenticoccus soli]|uniref:ParA family protein n=1 Tax=Halegenticoccus soli TaxID=1985678 RepID=UPI000C6E84D1|nr:ParA family protein [Halegenticoccus soli]